MAELVYCPANDTYQFETEAMTGEIRASGDYHGVWTLTDKVSGRQVIHPKYSALNLFRLFAVHQGLDQPRLMDRTVEARGQRH